MNIIIPLAGKGERFVKNGFIEPKPLIPIFGKCMIQYVLDNIRLEPNDKIFIFYTDRLDTHHFASYIDPNIQLIHVPETRGAAETLAYGLDQIPYRTGPCLVIDCDTFYTEDIVSICRRSSENISFYIENTDPAPIYSYLRFKENGMIRLNHEENRNDLDQEVKEIVEIREKDKISDHANTGAYFFKDIQVLNHWCHHVLERGIVFRGEPYTSCVISEMILANEPFCGIKLDNKKVFSLGTPSAVDAFIDRTYAYLFDLDGTLVITDDIYYKVWSTLLEEYNIVLDEALFRNVIQGNNDTYVMKYFHIKDPVSHKKDRFFIENIDKISIVPGVHKMLEQIVLYGHKICIVTNCNREVANKIVEHIQIQKYVDFIISSQDCKEGKPSPEPYNKAISKYGITNDKCFIFEDSKTGILSGKAICPNLLVGIETLYDRHEIMKYGVDMSLPNYLDFDPISLIEKGSHEPMIWIQRIQNSIPNCRKVVMDITKLKGGFIADINQLTILTEDRGTMECVIKYENTSENGLSDMAKKLDLYNREYSFYKEYVHKVPVAVPSCYGIVMDENEKACGMVLENLMKRGFQINLNLNRERIDVSLKIVDRMAKLHSHFWEKPLNHVLRYSDQQVDPFLHGFVEERFPLFQKNGSK